MGTLEQKQGRRTMDKTIRATAKAYKEGMDAGIQKIIEEMEESVRACINLRLKGRDPRVTTNHA